MRSARRGLRYLHLGARRKCPLGQSEREIKWPSARPSGGLMSRANVYVVQFIHPGKEHRANGAIQTWSTGAHARKFMRVQGRYVDKADSIRDGGIAFWGEWEAQSRVVRQWEPEPGLPRFLVEP